MASSENLKGLLYKVSRLLSRPLDYPKARKRFSESPKDLGRWQLTKNRLTKYGATAGIQQLFSMDQVVLAQSKYSISSLGKQLANKFGDHSVWDDGQLRSLLIASLGVNPCTASHRTTSALTHGLQSPVVQKQMQKPDNHNPKSPRGSSPGVINVEAACVGSEMSNIGFKCGVPPSMNLRGEQS